MTTMKSKSSKYMTWNELTQAFPERWVLLLNPQVPETGYEVHGGATEDVLSHNSLYFKHNSKQNE